MDLDRTGTHPVPSTDAPDSAYERALADLLVTRRGRSATDGQARILDNGSTGADDGGTLEGVQHQIIIS